MPGLDGGTTGFVRRTRQIDEGAEDLAGEAAPGGEETEPYGKQPSRGNEPELAPDAANRDEEDAGQETGDVRGHPLLGMRDARHRDDESEQRADEQQQRAMTKEAAAF